MVAVESRHDDGGPSYDDSLPSTADVAPAAAATVAMTAGMARTVAVAMGAVVAVAVLVVVAKVVIATAAVAAVASAQPFDPGPPCHGASLVDVWRLVSRASRLLVTSQYCLSLCTILAFACSCTCFLNLSHAPFCSLSLRFSSQFRVSRLPVQAPPHTCLPGSHFPAPYSWLLTPNSRHTRRPVYVLCDSNKERTLCNSHILCATAWAISCMGKVPLGLRGPEGPENCGALGPWSTRIEGVT